MYRHEYDMGLWFICVTKMCMVYICDGDSKAVRAMQVKSECGSKLRKQKQLWKRVFREIFTG